MLKPTGKTPNKTFSEKLIQSGFMQKIFVDSITAEERFDVSDDKMGKIISLAHELVAFDYKCPMEKLDVYAKLLDLIEFDSIVLKSLKTPEKQHQQPFYLDYDNLFLIVFSTSKAKIEAASMAQLYAGGSLPMVKKVVRVVRRNIYTAFFGLGPQQFSITKN